MTDKLNHVDFRWYIVRTRPRQELRLSRALERYKADNKNILEVYVPTHTTVNVRYGDTERQAPLFAGFVFVLATQSALVDFMRANALGDILQYERKRADGKTRLRVIPEEQMRAFRDYNENYADKVIVLERPYTDYAFNPKADRPNEIVRVVDGPLAGREGYICRFRKERRLVFQVRGIEPGSYLTVSYPNAWDLHVVRLHNAESDRLSVATEKERAADLLIGMLQACGYGERTLPMFHDLIERLTFKPSLVSLCQHLHKKGEEALSTRLARMSGQEAQLLLNLTRYEHDNPGYVKRQWPRLIIRPFLTPTAGVEMEDGQGEASLRHEGFTELIRETAITEETSYPSLGKSETVTTTYYAHIGCLDDKETGTYTLFANWHDFLSEYFLTAGKANEKLLNDLHESFRVHAPTLHRVLTDAHSTVKAVSGFKVGKGTLNVMMTTVADMTEGTNELLKTCVDICRELNTTTHLAIWRRYLRSVWLHL